MPVVPVLSPTARWVSVDDERQVIELIPSPVLNEPTLVLKCHLPLTRVGPVMVRLSGVTIGAVVVSQIPPAVGLRLQTT